MYVASESIAAKIKRLREARLQPGRPHGTEMRDWDEISRKSSIAALALSVILGLLYLLALRLGWI